MKNELIVSPQSVAGEPARPHFARTVKELAEILSVSEETITQLEGDDRSPTKLPGGAYNVRRWFNFLDDYGPDDYESTLRLWDKMHGEPDLWYARFRYYLHITPISERSIEKTFRDLTRSPSAVAGRKKKHSLKVTAGNTWHTACREWRWKERAAAWDIYMARSQDEITATEWKRLQQVQISANAEMRDIALRALRKKNINKIDTFAAAQMLANANRGDRALLGADGKGKDAGSHGDCPIPSVVVLPPLEDLPQ